MNPVVISLIAIGIFLVLLALGTHIAIALTVAGFVGMTVYRGLGPALSELQTIPWNTAASFSFAVIPLFMLMGNFAFFSGISAELFDTCYKWIGRYKGGLGFAAIGATSLFHCLCGSATATTATMGKVCLPEMTKYKYKPGFSTGAIASSGAFGLLIPPSVGFIVYGTTASISIGSQFAAGIIPAVMVIIMSFITIAIITKRDPEAAPAGHRFTFLERLYSLKGIIGFGVLFILVLGGILTGFISPSEGGAVGAFGSFVIMIIRKQATVKNIISSLRDSIKTTAMIFCIMIGANIFGTFLAMAGLPKALAKSLTGGNLNEYVVLWIVIVLFVILGCFVDSLPLIIILTPIFLPLVKAMEWNLYWFGIIMVMCMLIGLITPPVGMSVYVMAGVAKADLMTVFRGCTPYLFMLIIAMVILVYVPQLSTWLPSFMRL
ncbi:MAG: TRAP transporter large permease [Clostridiales Family XIII bacterium]|jgi:tripartite ATP-independent transporter DctM subunit|nr:TRAP transporter large permease [Clostridiales Family XIII bacterium]